MWHKLQRKMDAAIERGKAAILIGDLNRPLQLGINSSFGTKLLELWLEGESVTLLNDRKICTRFDPVTDFEVDTHKKWTPFVMTKDIIRPQICKSKCDICAYLQTTRRDQ